MKEMIQVRGLKKNYKDKTILNGLDFDVRQGEIFALLGANGAGKTTTLECMEGLKRYDGGSIRIEGSLGIQLQSASLPGYIRVNEAIRLFERWKGADDGNRWSEAFGLGEFFRQKYLGLSTGQKRRLHLALALIGDPEILFLDEPTAGLDVEGRIRLHGEIRRLKAQGKTMILASHDMAEVESLCDRIAILNGGKIAFLGTVEELTAEVGKHYNITIRTGENTERVQTEQIGETLFALLKKYQEKQAAILDIQIDRGSLEQHFMKIAKGEKE